MATYIATAPDGKEYEIDAPEGATQEQALDYFKSNWKPQEQPQAPKEEVTLKRFMEHPLDTLASAAVKTPAEYVERGIMAPLNISHGARQGVSNIGVNAAELANAISPEKAAEYKSAVQQKLQEYGADPQSAAFKTGEFAGETLPLMGLGGAAGAGARMAKLPENVAAAAESFGLSTGPSKTYLKDYVAKVGAGALMNTAGGQLLDPNSSAMGNAGFGALAGATSGVLAPVARGVAMLGKPLYESGRQAILDAKILESLRGTKPPEAVEKLRGGMSPEQLAVDIQSPDLAANIQSSEINKATAPEWSAKRKAEEEALASRVNQAQSSLNALHHGELPNSNVSANAPYQNVRDAQIAQAGGLENTKAARTAELLRQAETQQVGLEEAKQGVISAVAQPAQRDVGLALAGKKVELEQAARVEPSKQYTAAYEQAPQKFSFEPLLTAAGDIKNSISTEIDRNVAPKVHEILKALKGKENDVPEILGANGKPLNPKAGDLPFEGTLKDAHDLRSAILADLRDINKSTDSRANLTKRNLEKLEAGINQTIAQGVPESAGETFTGANKLFRESVAAPYMEGMAKKLTVENTLSRPSLSPSEVTEKALHPDHAIDFVNAFGSDLKAMQTIEEGIEGKFKNALKKGSQAGADFIEKHSEALDTLDSAPASLFLKDRLSNFVRYFGDVEAKQAALGEQVKAIPKVVDESVANQQRIISKSAKDLSGVSDAENLAKVAVSGDARLMGRILHKLTPEAKPELANQVISNAFEPITAGAENAGAKTVKALENSRIATLLKATYGKEEGAAKLADFKETANIQSMLEKVKKEAPNHPYDTAQALDNLTEGKPALKRTIEKIMSVLNDQEQFEALAMTGRRIGENTKKMASEATPHTPYQLTTEGATLRWIHGLVTKQADKAIAEKLSRELMSSEAFANAIERAQSRLPYDERNLRIGAGGLAGQSLSALQSRTSYSGEK
jgi:ribosomal protein S7